MDSSGFIADRNRSFLFGDGIFETMRMENGRLLYSSFHFDRLTRSLKALGIETDMMPKQKALEELIVRNVNLPQLRVKLLAFRSSTGAYVPEMNTAGFQLQVFPLDNSRSINEKGITVGLYEEQRKAAGALSWMKSTSSLLYVMAGRYAEQMGWDDILLLNDKNELMEGSSSNLFAWTDERWITPPISSGCIEGVFRRILISALKENGIPFSERSINRNEVKNADELILTNAISGIRWIERFEEKTYSCKESRKLLEAVSSFS
ncbi:MAG: hypothetical protein RLZZ630_2206 [Bacteroidota bacterium]